MRILTVVEFNSKSMTYLSNRMTTCKTQKTVKLKLLLAIGNSLVKILTVLTID